MEGKQSGAEIKQRLCKNIAESRLEQMSEKELLESLISYCVPKDIVQETVENLLEYFSGNFERIFYADIDTLACVDGISKNAAAFVHLVRDVKKRIMLERNEGVKRLNSVEESKEYVKNVLCNLSYERFIVITLNKDNEILSCTDVAEGTVNLAEIEPMKLVKYVMLNGADAVIIAHNHPQGFCAPSNQDLTFTKNLCSLLNQLDIKISDHLIVGKNGVYSMRENETIKSR